MQSNSNCEIKNGLDYENGGSVRIENHKEVRKWLFNPARRPKKWAKISIALFGFNKEAFKLMWGRQTFCWTGGSEGRRFWVWVHDLGSCQLIAMTSSVKGTSYEFIPNPGFTDKKVGDDVITFLKKIVEELNEHA